MDIQKFISRIEALCFEVGVFSPIVTYIDKNTSDLTNIPKSRFTSEYPDFKLSHDSDSDDYEFPDIYFSIDDLSDYQKVKDYIEYLNEEILPDYAFYTKKYLEEFGWFLDEKGNIIDWID